MVFNGASYIGLIVSINNQRTSQWTVQRRTANKMLGSLVTIWFKARRAFVRTKTGGASRASSITLSIGWNKFLKSWVVPINSANRSMCATSSWELHERFTSGCLYLERTKSDPTLNTSTAGSFQMSRRAFFIFEPNRRTSLRSTLWSQVTSPVCERRMLTCCKARASSCPNNAAWSVLAL